MIRISLRACTSHRGTRRRGREAGGRVPRTKVASRRILATRPRPLQVLRRVDVHEKEVRVPEPPQLSLDVLHRIQALQEFAHGSHPAVERRPNLPQYLVVVGGAQRVRLTPMARHDGKGAAPLETLEQVADHLLRDERHVTRGDEDEAAPRGGETGLQTGERPQAAAPLVGDPAYPSEPHGVSTASHHDDLRAAGRESVAYPAKQRPPADLQKK